MRAAWNPGELEATREQFQRLVVAAEARGEFGQHADRGDIVRHVPESNAQLFFGFGQAVFEQRLANRQHRRVLRRLPHVAQVGRVGAGGVAVRAQRIGQRQPCARRFGLLRGRPAQSRDRLVVAPEPGQRAAEIPMRLRPVGQARQWAEMPTAAWSSPARARP